MPKRSPGQTPNKRSAWMQRIRQNAQNAQMYTGTRQAFRSAFPGGQPPQSQPPQPKPQSALPQPVQPPSVVQPPVVTPSIQTKSSINPQGGVGSKPYGPKKPGAKDINAQGGVGSRQYGPQQVPAVQASSKLAKAQMAYQQKADVAKRLKREEQRETLQTLAIGQNLVSAAQALPQTATARLDATPTPFGIAFPLLILIVLYLMLIPVNGKSRLEWLWLTIIRQAYITTKTVIPASTPSSPGGLPGEGPGGTIATGTGGQYPYGNLVVNTDTGSYVYNGGDF